MLTNLKKYFAENISLKDNAGVDETDRNIQIATCALLLEMANSDDQFTDDEKARITAILKSQFGLDDNQVNELLELTKRQLDKSLDLYGFAKLINEHYGEKQRIAVIELIWEVIYADGQLSGYEDYLVHKYQAILGLTHKQLIDAKMRVLERLNKDK
jgi:uncharacterized tellurite resistance protein B-like protein